MNDSYATPPLPPSSFALGPKLPPTAFEISPLFYTPAAAGNGWKATARARISPPLAFGVLFFPPLRRRDRLDFSGQVWE